MKEPDILLWDTVQVADVVGRWDWDIPNDRLYGDATLAQLFSVDPALARAGAPLRLFLEGIHRDDRDRTAEIIARSVEAGRSYVQKYRVLSADGVTRWVLARGLVECDAAGRPRRGTGFLIDLTGSRRDGGACPDGRSEQGDHPSELALELAAEHCLAARQAITDLSEPLLQRMVEMLLLEIARRLARQETDRRRAQWH